jgi:hypothetical protein
MCNIILVHIYKDNLKTIKSIKNIKIIMNTAEETNTNLKTKFTEKNYNKNKFKYFLGDVWWKHTQTQCVPYFTI